MQGAHVFTRKATVSFKQMMVLLFGSLTPRNIIFSPSPPKLLLCHLDLRLVSSCILEQRYLYKLRIGERIQERCHGLVIMHRREVEGSISI